MKAVLISIRPEWCAKIMNGKKTIEVRKTRPKIETPFKCYIYCTKSQALQFWTNPRYSYADDHSHNLFDRCGNGKVIGEFVCDKFYTVDAENNAIMKYAIDGISFGDFLECAQLSAYELLEYLSSKRFDREYDPGYGWHISDLRIYDEPIGLYEFRRKCESVACEGCDHLKYQRVNSDEYDYDCEFYRQEIPLTRPPQSWCYVEEVRDA